MQYKELVNFEPIETVVHLCEAAKEDYAYGLIDTYVISDRMAEIISEVIIEQLQYNYPADNKGLFIVGNYGTGKSHLMSVIASLAELPGAPEHVKNKTVKEATGKIAGKFKVIRTEIGATTMPLRDMICAEIEDYLDNTGVDYSFPAMTAITNNKDSFHAMMDGQV